MEPGTEYVSKTHRGERSRFFLQEARRLLSRNRPALARLAYLTLLLPLTVLGTIGACGLLRRGAEECFSRVWPAGSALDLAWHALCGFAAFFLSVPLLSRLTAGAAELAGTQNGKPQAYARFLYAACCLLSRLLLLLGVAAALGVSLLRISRISAWLGLSDHVTALLLFLLGGGALALCCCLLSAVFLLPHLLALRTELSGREAKKAARRAVRGHRIEIIRFHFAFLPSLLLAFLSGGLMLFYTVPYYTTASVLFAAYLLRVGPRGTVRTAISEHYRSTEVPVT